MALKARTKFNKLELTKQVAEQGEIIDELQAKMTAVIALANELKADKATLLAKLDADAGVTDTNYAATCATAAADVTI